MAQKGSGVNAWPNQLVGRGVGSYKNMAALMVVILTRGGLAKGVGKLWADNPITIEKNGTMENIEQRKQ